MMRDQLEQSSSTTNSETESLSLAGSWSVRLDPADIGLAEGWERQSFETSSTLPGSLDTNGIGNVNPIQDYMGGLSRKVSYVGPAWFSKTVEIPVEWLGRDLLLSLERVHWFSQVWINGVCVGHHESLSVPHIYRIAASEASQLDIVMRIDNAPHIPIGRISHALTDWTQTNWNGVIGAMTLAPVPDKIPVFQVRSSVDGLRVWGIASPDEPLQVLLNGTPCGSEISVASAEGVFGLRLPARSLPLWSDREPNLFEVTLRSPSGESTLQTGYRRFSAVGQKFQLNGKSIFLRGTLECCVFPKTGFPPTDVESWITVMQKAREYGLNHIRFHSWCPPEAAFAAADQVGILIQAELPLWTGKWPTSSDAELMAFCRREAFRILEQYGHHPSLTLFTLGNELAFYGEEPQVDQLLNDLKAAFPHILFNFSSHGTHLSTNCDYYVQADNGKPEQENRPLRGSTWFGVGSRFDRERPATLTTCTEAASQFDRPVIAHEVGEWAVFPNVETQSDYDGALEARNFACIQRQLQARGMESQANAFTCASGKLSAQLYKEEIETLLRTQNLAGFQLLGLTDFPGQGTATIGMLDAFWKEKGLITGEEFREFCSATVPLLVTSRFVWQTDETFSADLLAFHNGELTAVVPEWTLADAAGAVCRSGFLQEASLVPGEPIAIGSIEIDLQGLLPAARYTLCVTLPGLGKNHWNLWVFAPSLPHVEIPEVSVFQWYRDDVVRALKEGRTVWLRLHPDKSWGGIWGRFAPAFWSPIHFQEQVGTMGTIIQKEHPLFAEFPTESYSEWQWWDLLTRSKSLVLNALPLDFRPLLQVIDRYERNHKLGTIFEANVGKGKLLVTYLDFDTPGRVAATQLEYSIKRYLESRTFYPTASITFAQLGDLFASEP